MNENTQLIPYETMEKMAVVLGRNRLFGKSTEDMLALMLVAQAEGLHPALAAQEYDIIQGRPALNSRSALARFQKAGGKIQWTKRTDAEASAEFSHPQGGKLTVSWTMERAKNAGLIGKDNWKKFPAQMLSARVAAEGVRAVFPACLSGMYVVEEVEDMEEWPEEPRNVTPPAEELPHEEPKPVTPVAQQEENKDSSPHQEDDIFKKLVEWVNKNTCDKPAIMKEATAAKDNPAELLKIYERVTGSQDLDLF